MEDTQVTPPAVALPVARKTVAVAEHRQKAEVEVGIEVQFFDNDDEKPENYLGSVWVNNDPEAYTVLLERLKAKKGKGKSYQWSEAELRPLRLSAENGTYWVKVAGWVEVDGTTPITDIARIMGFNFVRRKCNAILQDEQLWIAAANEETAKN